MLKKENPASMQRHKLLRTCLDMGLSSYTRMELTACMRGKQDEEKERLAEQLLAIISKSKSEKEMVEEAKKLM